MSFDLVGKAVKRIKLPVVDYDGIQITVIPAQEGDNNARYIIIELYDDRGTVQLSSYNKVALNVTLPDETLQYSDGEINKNTNEVAVELKGSMLQPGKLLCDVSLEGTDGNGLSIRLTSKTFCVYVANSQSGNSAIIGTDEYNILNALIDRVVELEQQIEPAIDAETGRVEAEEGRVANEIARQEAEAEREGTLSAIMSGFVTYDESTKTLTFTEFVKPNSANS